MATSNVNTLVISTLLLSIWGYSYPQNTPQKISPLCQSQPAEASPVPSVAPVAKTEATPGEHGFEVLIGFD